MVLNVFNSEPTKDENTTSRPRPLPSIAASVPGGRMGRTLPAFTAPVPSSRMSSTLPATSGKLSMHRTARRKDIVRDEHPSGGRQSGRRRRRPDELVLRVVSIDISADDSPRQHDRTNSEVQTHSAAELHDEDSGNAAPRQFERMSKVRRGKYFKRCGKKFAGGAAADAEDGVNDLCPQQVCLPLLNPQFNYIGAKFCDLAKNACSYPC